MLLLVIIVVSLVLIYWLFMSPFSQVFGSFPYQVKTKQKVVALTFDDGPNEPYTSALLDILDRQKVKATFFMVGKCVERYPEIVKRVAQTGHTIGNHGWSHQFGRYFIEPSYRHQIDKTQVLINKTIGQTPALFRPPWLWRQPMLMTTVKQKGLQIVSGRFGHELEVFQPSAKIMAKRTLKKVRPGAIIIFHDGFDARGGNRHQTVEAVRLIIEELKRQGYQFVTVDQLLVIKAYS